MSGYFEHVERELSAAVRRRAHLPWYMSLRAKKPRALVVLLAALVIAGPAIAAVTLLQTGAPVRPQQPPTPRAFNGVALKRGAELLPLRVADPAGGPPWGMKLIRTSRGLLCVQVGRVAFGTVGALGVDGAFHNDGRFHPFSVNYQSGPSCVTPDAHRHGFMNAALYEVPTSALFGDGLNGCRTATVPLSGLAPIGKRRVGAYDRQPTCKRSDLRDVYVGLLGPEAVRITYQAGNGHLVSEPTVGGNGAYLIVRRTQGASAHPGVGFGGGQGLTSDAGLFPGAIRTVRYRDSHACQLPPPAATGGGECPPVGYVAPTAPLPRPAQVASRIRVRLEPSPNYCVQPPPSEVVVPCPVRVPAGLRRLDMSRGPKEILVVVSFVSRVSITSGQSYYYIQRSRAPYPDPRYSSGGNGEACGAGNVDFGRTDSDYSRGQLVKQFFFEPLGCRGPVHGDISLVIIRGAAGPAPMPAVPGQSVGRNVGHFRFTVP